MGYSYGADVGPNPNVTCILGNGQAWNSSGRGNITCDFLLGKEEYEGPFDIVYIRVLFIILYSSVFACCFVGKC